MSVPGREVISGQQRLGIAAHITSLPGAGARGTLGVEAYQFVDFLAGAGASVWQVLPLNPVNAYGSPYQSSCVFAGNTALLPEGVAEAAPDDGYAEFRAAQAHWLDDYALFTALHAEQAGQPWYLWLEDLRDREPHALRKVRARLASEIEAICCAQYQFTCTWRKLREYAHRAGVYLFGDLPMFVAHDSSDVWSHREFFCMDETGRMTQVAGAPPDAFNPGGQNWGCPEYRWDALAADGYRWWRARLAQQAGFLDILRLDHFRGFEASWSIPAGAGSGAEGRWVPVPGAELFAAVQPELEPVQLVAENLGNITPVVEHLRADLGLPGMRVLQFAFDSGPDNPHLPRNHDPADVVYTGTHDNDTTLGWWRALDAAARARVLDGLHDPHEAMPWALMDTALASSCWLAMLPLQDCLGLGSEARMNTPGRVAGNWAWRAAPGALSVELQKRLAELARLYGRNSR